MRNAASEALGRVPTPANEVKIRQSDIQDLLNESLDLSDRILTKIARLENRISSVLISATENPAGGAAPEVSQKTKLAENIREINRRLENASARLTEITDRCDLPE